MPASVAFVNRNSGARGFKSNLLNSVKTAVMCTISTITKTKTFNPGNSYYGCT